MKKIFVLIGCFLFLTGCERHPDQYLMDLCLRTSIPADYSKCKCTVLKYEDALSREERSALLNSTGHLFPGYGWDANGSKKLEMTFSILDKYHKAEVACGIVSQ